MASSTSHQRSHVADGIVRPRPMKPGNPMVLRAQEENGGLKANGGFSKPEVPGSGMSSGCSTPLPPDAPPSAVSISSARRQIRAQQKHRLFPTIDYAARVSHFDPRSDYRDFRGFFVLFWIGLAIMVITTMLRNIKDTGFPFRVGVWALLTERVWQLALSDGAMVLSTMLSLPLHRVFRNSKGWLRWENGGMAVQSIYQAIWLTFWVKWPFMVNWTWTAQVFFTLHTITFLMKMHSYAFYNGHLSTTEHRLSALDNPESASTAAAVRYPSSSIHLNEINKGKEKKMHKDEDEALAELREDLALELTSPLGQVTYPQNLTSSNYADYILCPPSATNSNTPVQNEPDTSSSSGKPSPSSAASSSSPSPAKNSSSPSSTTLPSASTTSPPQAKPSSSSPKPSPYSSSPSWSPSSLSSSSYSSTYSAPSPKSPALPIAISTAIGGTVATGSSSAGSGIFPSITS